MTKDQVRFVLGTPLVADIFHEDRWDYVYRRQRQNSTQVRSAGCRSSSTATSWCGSKAT